MNKTKKLFLFLSSLIMGVVLSRFAISKLTGWEVSVNAFIEMAKPLGVNPTFFRLSTGILILIVFISYLTTAFLTIFNTRISMLKKNEYYNIAFFANMLGLLTMIGALLAEFLLRIQPKWLLVYIAFGVIIFSIINLLMIKNSSSLFSKLINPKTMHKVKIMTLAIPLFLILSCKNDTSKENNNSTTIETQEMEKQIETTLASELEERKINFNNKADGSTKKIYKEGLDAVAQSGIIESAKNVGDMAPNFTLKNALGTDISLETYLAKGPVVLIWYRGGWCPYCNLTLHALQDELPNIKANGANLIALTPELPDQSISTTEKHQLEFEVLSDVGNSVAKDYGVVFKLTDAVSKIYNDKFSLNDHNGDSSNELPLAATYIINTDGKIEYAFLDPDYRKRAEPSDITGFLKSMKK